MRGAEFFFQETEDQPGQQCEEGGEEEVGGGAEEESAEAEALFGCDPGDEEGAAEQQAPPEGVISEQVGFHGCLRF